MNIPPWIETIALGALDQYFALLPQAHPSLESLQRCKIVSHRGEHNNRSAMENTFAAFDLALDSNVWGVECDIRWTKNLHPVIIHDRDCQRVFNRDICIADVTLSELKEAVPQIPTLEEMVQRYGKKLHLMLEIKEENYPNPKKQNEILQNILASLAPVEDFHFLALEPEIFRHVELFPRQCFLPVAELNVHRLSKNAIESGYGGLSGHYLFLNMAVLNAHADAKQKIGTGFISSRYALFRELNRGVEWVFSNDAEKIQAICDACLKKQ